jgi:hypothetical protein
MDKKEYEKIVEIRSKISKGEKTTFHERNIVNIYDKRMKAQKRIDFMLLSKPHSNIMKTVKYLDKFSNSPC